LLELTAHNEGAMLSTLQNNLEMSGNTLYNSIKYLLDNGLIVEQYTYNRCIFTLTEKGKKITRLLVEVDNIMK